MIGEDSTTSRPPSGSASTGQPPAFWHSATAGCAQIGGSVIEMNSPPVTLMIVCAATSADGSASSRRLGTGPTAVRFSTRTWSRTARHGPGTGIVRTDTAPASGSRRRTVYRGPVPSFGPPASPSGSRSSPPPMANSRTTPSDRSAPAPAVTSISCSTASSQAWSAASPDPSVVRRWTWRNRRMTWTTGWPVCSRTHSAWVKLVSEGSAAAYPGAITTPNCQRLWFF